MRIKKRGGDIGLECRPEKRVDIVCALECPPSLANAVTDEVRAHHVLEHVRNPIPFVEEFCRVTRHPAGWLSARGSGATAGRMGPASTDRSVRAEGSYV